MGLVDGKLTIIGLDPGGTTGWAMYVADVIHHPVDPDLAVPTVEFYNGKWNAGQIGPDPHHRRLWNFLEQWTTVNTIIVCESFEFRKNEKDRTRDNIVLDSKEYIGVVNLYKQTYDATTSHDHPGSLEVVFQTSGMVIPGPAGNAFWTDEKLERVGHLAKPKTTWRHANDAMRHLLYYMLFKMNRQDLLEPFRSRT